MRTYAALTPLWLNPVITEEKSPVILISKNVTSRLNCTYISRLSFLGDGNLSDGFSFYLLFGVTIPPNYFWEIITI